MEVLITLTLGFMTGLLGRDLLQYSYITWKNRGYGKAWTHSAKAGR